MREREQTFLTIPLCAFLLDVMCRHVVSFLVSTGELKHEEGAQDCGWDCRLLWLSSIVFPPLLAPDLLRRPLLGLPLV